MEVNSFDSDIKICLEILRAGGIILYPTDTIWGIGCDATNASAVKKIYQLKKREEKKSLIILVNDDPMINNYVLHPSKKIIEFLFKQKNPTTAIFENAFNLPKEIIIEDGSIAIRIVRDEFCKTLIQLLTKPLVSTSANISGEKYPENFGAISEEIKKGVEYIAQHRQQEIKIAEPSSIIRLNNSNEIIQLR